MILGYTSGVYDLFHIGHLNLLNEIDKFQTWEKLKFDILFVVDDWYEMDSWKSMENRFKEVNVRVVYFPYTKGTSSTLINEILIVIFEIKII